MAKVETNTRKVIERLKAEGWVNIGVAVTIVSFTGAKRGR